MQRQKSLFYKKIKCHCGANFKFIKEKQKNKYVCSQYANYRTCQRNIVEESLLLEMLNRRGKTVSEVSEILIDERGNIEIFYNKDEKYSQIVSDRLIRF
jgi:hypothetical protein